MKGLKHIRYWALIFFRINFILLVVNIFYIRMLLVILPAGLSPASGRVLAMFLRLVCQRKRFVLEKELQRVC